ncbi:MAG: Ig-like domain-containing protein [Eubacteriales bacterium]|nr:Ig-like domain-containing protein [Eubacteriales bacterium]
MKKILAFTLALAMVLSSTTMTFAASKEVEALANLKLLLNTTDAEVNADLNRAVGLAMVLKALGYTQEDANAKAEANTFVDMEKFGWAKGFTVLGEELKITNGTSVEPKMFSPNANLNERAFVAFMLRALGYDVDAAWAKAGEIAKEAGVAETVTENKLTKGDAAVIMYKALMAKVQGDEKGRTLAQKLVDEKKLDKDLAVANGLISGEPEKLTVTAMADNLKEITVSFDGTVDKVTAEKAGNYKVKGYTVEKAMVQEDGRTVVLTVKNSLANKKEFDLTVTGVKNVAGVVMDKQTVKFSTNDVTPPSVNGITVTGPRNFEINYSEPMNAVGTIAVKYGKNGKLSVKEAKYSDSKRALEVTLYNDFKEGTEYVVVIGDGKKNSDYPTDFAGYTTTYHEETLTYAKDTTAPEVKVVKADQTRVTLEFTKPVKGLDKKFFAHTFSSYHPVKLVQEDGKTALESGKAYSKVVLVFYSDESEADKKASHAIPAGEVKLMVRGKIGNDKIEDNWKNQLADVELPMTITADREAPEVVSVEVKNKQEVEVTFSEAIVAGANWKKELTVQLLDKDGKVVEKNETATLTEKSDNDKVYTIKFKESYVGKTMTLVLKGVKDKSLYANVMADYSTTLEFTDKEFNLDKTKAEFKKVMDGNTARFFLYVTYDEEMDDSVLEVANYKLRKTDTNTDYDVKGTADFLEGNRKIVAIELDFKAGEANSNVDIITGQANGSASDAVASRALVIKGEVKDLAGNKDSKGQFEKAVTLGTLQASEFKITAAKAVANDMIEVELSREAMQMDHSTTTWTVSGNREVLEVNMKSEKVLTLKLKDSATTPLLPSDADGVTLAFNNAGSEIKDIFGNTLSTYAATQITDKINPAVAAFKLNEVAGDNGNYDTEDEMFTTATTNESDKKGKPVILVSDLQNEGQASAQAKLKVKYTENIALNSVAITTYVLNNGWKVTAVDSSSDKVVTLTIKKSEGKKDELKELTVVHKGTVVDANGNQLKGNDDVMPTINNLN